MTSYHSYLFSIWMEPSLTVLSGFTMPLLILLRNWGVPSPDDKIFVVLWDQPLESSFATCLPKDQISEAVQIYRSYYKVKGIHEAQLFPQIVDLLGELSSKYPLYITTTKNTPTAQDMTKKLGNPSFL